MNSRLKTPEPSFFICDCGGEDFDNRNGLKTCKKCSKSFKKDNIGLWKIFVYVTESADEFPVKKEPCTQRKQVISERIGNTVQDSLKKMDEQLDFDEYDQYISNNHPRLIQTVLTERQNQNEAH